MKTKHTIASIALTALSLSANADLARVGSVNPVNGFPSWYQDLGGTTLDLCLPNASDSGALQQSACLLTGTDVEPPYIFPTNYPDELFYFRGVSIMDVATGKKAVLVLALEAAFGTGAPVANQQSVFTRIRVTAGVPEPGTYTVTHPYGKEVFPDIEPSAGSRDIFFTEDVGIAPLVFTDALTSRFGPFISAALTAPTALVPSGTPKPPVTINGAQFISDGAAQEFVTGSPFETNFFMICGTKPDGVTPIDLGDALADGSGYNAANGTCVRTDLFALTGRLHNYAANPIPTPLNITSATYSRDASGTHVDVHASASKPLSTLPDPVVTIASADLPPVKMIGPDIRPDKSMNYYVQGTVPDGNLPGLLTAINSADTIPSTATRKAVDVITITSANYNPATGTITVIANSSDKGFGIAQPPALILLGYPTDAVHTSGSSDPSSMTLTTTLPLIPLKDNLPPTTITVQSEVGGSKTFELAKGKNSVFSSLLGVPFTQDDNASAMVTGAAVIIPVTENDIQSGSPINPNSIVITEQAATGTGTVVANADNTVTFTPGAIVTDTTFKYLVNSAAGRSNVATVTVAVTAPPAGAAPIAVADGPINVLAGKSVVIDVLANDISNGSALTVDAPTSVSGGTAVVENGKVKFTAGTTPMTTSGFNYTVSNTSGISASVRVSVPVVVETINFTKIQCKSNAWRITGTTSIAANNSMTFYRGSTTTGQTIGSVAVVSGTGVIDFRATSSCTTSPVNRISVKSALGTERLGLTVTN